VDRPRAVQVTLLHQGAALVAPNHLQRQVHAWLCGVAVVSSVSYLWMWWVDAALALGAALVNLPIRYARLTTPGTRVSVGFGPRLKDPDDVHPFNSCIIGLHYV